MVPITTRSVHFSRYGTAVPGFFDFGKFCFIIHISVLLIYSIYVMRMYYNEDKCNYKTPKQDATCGSKWKFNTSAANGKQVSYTVERILLFVAFLVCYLIKIYYYRKIRKQEAEADEVVTDITDYSIEIRGLPKDATQLELRQFFLDTGIKDSRGQPLRVASVNFVFTNIKDITKRDHELTYLIGQYIQAKTKNDKKKCDDIEDRFTKLARETRELVQSKFRISRERKEFKEMFTGNCYVSFETQQMTEAVSNKLAVRGVGKVVYKILGALRGPFRFLKGARRHRLSSQSSGYFYIEKAEKPREIKYENLGRTFKQKSLTKLYTMFITLCIIVGTFCAVFFLKNVESTEAKKGNTTITVLITVVIKIIGFFCSFITPKLVDLEKPETITQRNIGVIWRSCISVFLNSAVVITVATWYFKTDKDLEDELFSDKGLTNNLYFLMIFGILEPFVSFIDANYILKLWKRRKLVKQLDSSTMMQYECNTLYEDAAFDFANRSGKYCNITLIVFFNLNVLPVASIFGMAWIFVYYWVDKYFLVRRARIPDLCTGDLMLSLLRIVDVGFLVVGLSYMVFDQILFESVSKWSWILTIIAGGILLLNVQYIMRKIFVFESDEAESAQITYRDFLKTAKKGETYRSTNPVDVLWGKVQVYTEDEFLVKIKNRKDLDFADDSEKLMLRMGANIQFEPVQKGKDNKLSDSEALLKLDQLKQTPRDSTRKETVKRIDNSLQEFDDDEAVRYPIYYKPTAQITASGSQLPPGKESGSILQHKSDRDVNSHTPLMTENNILLQDQRDVMQ